MTTGSFSMVSVDYLGKLDLVGDYLTALSARKKISDCAYAMGLEHDSYRIYAVFMILVTKINPRQLHLAAMPAGSLRGAANADKISPLSS